MSAVTVKGIIEALREISVLPNYQLHKAICGLSERIEQHGIAPPDGWQPIETAPGNCLVYSDGDVFQARKTAIGSWKCPDPSGGGEYWLDAAPTHWMPIPDAPEVEP